jgi:hypothetical protein
MTVSNSLCTLKPLFFYISLEFFCSFDCCNSFLGHGTRADSIPLSLIHSSCFNHKLLRLRGAGIESHSPSKDARNEEKNSVDEFKAFEVIIPT